MTAEELARVTAERDAAVAALARVEALAQKWADADDEPATGCDLAALTAVNRCGRRLRRALAGAESDAGAEVAPEDPGESNGVQIGAQGAVIVVPKAQFDRLMRDDEEQR